MQFRRENIQYLEKDDIKPTNLSKAEIVAYAQKVRDLLKMNVKDDLVEIVHKLGGKIHYVDLDDLVDHPESIYVHGKHRFDLVLPNFTSRMRDRFTIAHELGHYFLHSQQGDKSIVACRQGSTRLEWEANWFAAELLMPKDDFTRFYHENSNRERIASHFGVSPEAAGVRVRELELAKS